MFNPNICSKNIKTSLELGLYIMFYLTPNELINSVLFENRFRKAFWYPLIKEKKNKNLCVVLIKD